MYIDSVANVKPSIGKPEKNMVGRIKRKSALIKTRKKTEKEKLNLKKSAMKRKNCIEH